MPGIGDVIAELLKDSSSDGDSSGGGGGGPTAPPTEAQILAETRAMRAFANLRASFRDVLRRWGLPSSKNLMNLMERGIRSGWTTTDFVDQLRHTPEYRKHFRGIRWREGMTEGTYLSTYSQYKARAQDIGVKLDKTSFAKLIKRGTTFDEFSDRVDAISSINQNAPLFAQFQAELQARGIAGKTNKKHLAKFVQGLGPKKWETVWERAFVTNSLEQVSGINVVGEGEQSKPDSYEISRNDMLNIIKNVESMSPGFEVESLSGRDFAEIGNRVRAHDMQYLRRYGLTTADLVEMELGGRNAVQTREKSERILGEQEAFLEPRALPQTAQQVGQATDQEPPQSL